MLMALAAGLTLVPMVTVDAREVRVGDLVRDGRHRLAGPAAMAVVMRLPAGQRRVSLAGDAVAMLVRRHVRGADVIAAPAVTISRRLLARAPQGCWASVRSLAVGEAITDRDATPVACGGEQASVGAEGDAPVVRIAVAAGAPLGRLAPVSAARVAIGVALTLRSVAGPVTIERTVTTLQAGRSGRRVFVRDEDGEVFGAPLALVEAGR